MFTYEEAAREVEEDKHIATFCKLAAAEMKSKCTNNKEGKKTVLSKMKELKKNLKIDLKELKNQLITLKQDQSAQDSEYKLVQTRSKCFDRDPAALETHGFSSRKNKERIVQQALEKKNDVVANVSKLVKKIAAKARQRKNNTKKWKEDALKVLVEENMVQTKLRMIDEGRVDAMKNNWRRPWDGEDGRLFKIWMQQKKGDTKKKSCKKDDPDGEEGYSSEGDETDDDEEEGGSEEESDYYDSEESEELA